ncbi:UNVERIFIED_CONTAM: putative L-type lectin-domain containing receptor kinase S.7 [Sesamum calycinum]|uniref:L-type lectin-domain containing receptor kinase S.7 n=1 Tax=Sesamum calycinum TaxID=2727403 RepID=A0AAW2Q550_9LAMI
MTTVEKLLVQIFERKNSIIEQVKQQTELYNQHLASKLLIDGISPPSWLWNPSASSDSKEINKEELISKLLHPYPRPSVRCSVAHYPAYNNLVFTGANEDFSDGVFMGHMAFDKGPSRQDDLSVPALTSEDHGLCALNYPEPDASVTSPEDQTDGRISNIYNAPDQSLVGIQRSKSRQKALVLRNSAKQPTKSSLSHENISNGFSNQIRFSLSAANQMGQKDELAKSPQPGPVGRQNCKDVDLDEADCEKKEKGTDARITRSGSYTEVPCSVSGSLTLHRSSEDCKEDASSAATKERRKGSTSVCDPEEADNSVDKSPKSVGQSIIYCQSGGDRQLDGSDCVSNGKEINVYTGRITRSKISGKRQNYACNSSKAESDAYQTIDIAMMDSQDQPSNYVDGSLTRFSPCNILNEGFEARESISGDSKSGKEKGAVASWSSSQHKTCVDEISGLDMHAHSAMVDGGIAPSSGGSALEVNDSGEVLGLVRHSVGLFRRVTRSQTRADDKEANEPVISFENPSFGRTMSQSGRQQKSAAEHELRKASSGQCVSTCHGTNNMLDQCGNAALLMPSELVLHDHVDQSGTSSSSDAKQRRIVGSQVGPPSDSFVFVEPKHLSFREIENYPSKGFPPDSEVKLLDNSQEKLGYSISDAAISLDKGISGDVNLLVSGMESEKPHVSSKAEEVQRGSLKSDFQENPDTLDEKNGTIVSDYPTSKSSKDNKDAGLNCKISGVQQEGNITRSKMVDKPESRVHPVKFHLEHGHESFPEPHIEESKSQEQSSDCSIEKVQMSNPSCVVLDERKQLPAQESQILSCPEGAVSDQHANSPGADNGFISCSTIRSPRRENSSPERRFRHASMESWPQPKRRKIEHQETHSFTTSPSLRVRRPFSNQRGPSNKYITNIGINVDTVLMDTFDLNTITDTEICLDVDSNLTGGIESTFLPQNQEVEFCKEKNEHKSLSSVINNEELGAALFSSLTKKEAKTSQGCFIEEMATPHSSSDHFDATEPVDGQCSQHLCDLGKNINNLDSENLTLTNAVLEGIQSPKWDNLQPQHSVIFAGNEDEELIDVDQSRPVFEGFIVDAQADRGELDLAEDRIDFDKLNLPRTTIERASILAEICKSASSDTPLSNFSYACGVQGTQNLLWSVPNGHLEHLDLRSTFPLNSGFGKQVQSGSSLTDNNKDASEGMPYTDYPSYSGTHIGWNSRHQQASPVGRLWERLSSHTGSSEKRLSSNPELTCFPIEEDPSISEGNKTVDDHSDDAQEEVNSSFAKHCDERHPLKDLTNLDLNPSLVSVQEKILRADSVDFVSKKFSDSGTQDKAQWSPKIQHMDRSVTRKTRLHLLVLLMVGRTKRKRDVKVKALEAAEAAKRLEEKKENERKMRKEALKHERAKLEEKNLRQMELEKKKKEEERKKKDADIIAKKRLREEEERKEKEKKRMRLEARQRQREQEEKMRSEKAEKEKQQKQRLKDEQMNSKLEFQNESKKQQNKDTIRGDNIALKQTETKLTPTEVVMNYEECVDESPKNEDLIGWNSQGKSYEISPYQCSDDEDDEEDELPTKKYIPSWASKNSVAMLLPLQQEMDPDVIFPPESFCRMDEVYSRNKWLHESNCWLLQSSSLENVTLEFPFFTPQDFTLLGDSTLQSGAVRLTRDLRLPSSSSGSVIYNYPIAFFNPETNVTASFSTRFSFSVDNINPSSYGDGLAFFLSPNNRTLGSPGGYLGLVNSSKLTQNRFIAIEFDTRQNLGFNDPDDNHVGLDIDSLFSFKTANPILQAINLKSGNVISAWVDYLNEKRKVEVFLSYSSSKPENPLFTVDIDLSDYLKEFMFVGFSASTEGSTELHYIKNWSFQTLGFRPVRPRTHPHNVSDNSVPLKPATPFADPRNRHHKRIALGLWISFPAFFCVVVLVIGWFL